MDESDIVHLRHRLAADQSPGLIARSTAPDSPASSRSASPVMPPAVSRSFRSTAADPDEFPIASPASAISVDLNLPHAGDPKAVLSPTLFRSHAALSLLAKTLYPAFRQYLADFPIVRLGFCPFLGSWPFQLLLVLVLIHY